MKIQVILFFLFICTCAHGQQIQRFYDENHKIADANKAAYYSILDYKDSFWTEKSYYLGDMKLYMYGRYRDSVCAIPVDTFYYFHRDGSLQEIGNYIDGKKDGIWLGYHTNGMMSDSSVYAMGLPVGNSFAWHFNGYMADSTSWIPGKEGSNFSWTGEGRLNSTGAYTTDRKKQGSWKFYHGNGRLSSSEVYDNDSLTAIKTFDEAGNAIPNDGAKTKTEIESEFPGGAQGWLSFLNRNMRYPDEAIQKEIQGAVIVQFIVDKQGEVSNIQVVSGPLEGGLREEAIRVIKKSGKWIPATSHGRKVKSYKKQPLVFRLSIL